MIVTSQLLCSCVGLLTGAVKNAVVQLPSKEPAYILSSVLFYLSHAVDVLLRNYPLISSSTSISNLFAQDLQLHSSEIIFLLWFISLRDVTFL